MDLVDMDDIDIERIQFATPSLTPHVSESSTSDYYDLECSFSQVCEQQRTLDLTRDLQEVADLCCQLGDNESESDVQDQQPTEATDNSNDSTQTQTSTVNTIDNSLHPQPSQEHDNGSLSAVQITDPVEESFSPVMSDTDPIPVEERHERQTLCYSPSLCVPYTDEQDEQNEISITKETLTTTSLEFTGLTKKHKHNLRHIMISYNHSTKVICSKIAKYLKNRQYIVWIDQDNISGDIFTSMASAIENSFVVLMAINEQYYQSRYCRLEAEYSVEQNKVSIPLMMQTDYKPLGWLGIINGAKLHIDFSKLPFDEAFTLLVREIEAVRIFLGIDGDDQTVAMPLNNQITTTTDNPWFHLQNVHDWSPNDVVEWLSREKLEIFEDQLRYYDGAALLQLYKIKLDSPSDYYRMVETLLPSTYPLRLLFNLKFYSAHESLFSSSIQTIHR